MDTNNKDVVSPAEIKKLFKVDSLERLNKRIKLDLDIEGIFESTKDLDYPSIDNVNESNSYISSITSDSDDLEGLTLLPDTGSNNESISVTYYSPNADTIDEIINLAESLALHGTFRLPRRPKQDKVLIKAESLAL